MKTDAQAPKEDGHVKAEADGGDAATSHEHLGLPKTGRNEEGGSSRGFGESVSLLTP